VRQIAHEPIGVIHTPFKQPSDTPIQGIFAPDIKGEVEVFPRYADGLQDVAGFSHLILIYHFHLAGGYVLTARPFLDNRSRGIFSIRHFKRPNNIGLSVVRLDAVRGNTLDISEVDIIDGTPLLDIKPYVPDFDQRSNVRTGWYASASNKHQYKQGKGAPQRLEDF